MAIRLGDEAPNFRAMTTEGGAHRGTAGALEGEVAFAEFPRSALDEPIGALFERQAARDRAREAKGSKSRESREQGGASSGVP